MEGVAVQLTRSPYNVRGLPLWALWAALPVALSLGFVTGLVLAQYTPQEPGGEVAVTGEPQYHSDDEPATPDSDAARDLVDVPEIPDVPDAGGTEARDPSAPGGAASVSPPEADFSWQIVRTERPDFGLGEGIIEPSLPPLGGTPYPSDPRYTYGPPAPMDIREARDTLAREFGLYSTESVSFSVQYQQMRHAGLGRSLVGMISVQDYPQWERALREEPGALEAWLRQAAERVRPAAREDGFHLAWAVVDVLGAKPAGFAPFEVTPLNDGTYLVVRPLAATADHRHTEVALRPLGSLSLAAAGQQAAMNSPWSIYGPVLRFDQTDIYRPVSPGVKPAGD